MSRTTRAAPLAAASLAVLAVLAAPRIARAQLVSISVSPAGADDHDILPFNVSAGINGPGEAAGLDGTLQTGTTDKGQFQGDAWAALVYRDLDRLQVGVSEAAHPSPLAPASYLRAQYVEVSANATGYPLVLGLGHHDRGPSVLGLFGTTFGYDQRNYRGVSSGPSVDRVINAGENVFGLVLASPGEQLPETLNVLDTSAAFDITNFAFKTSLDPLTVTGWQISTPSPATGRAWYLDLAGGVSLYEPPITNLAGAVQNVQHTLSASGELYYGDAEGHLGIGAYSAPDLGLTDATSGVEDRAYADLSRNFLDDELTLTGTAWWGRVTSTDEATGRAAGFQTRGLSADAGARVGNYLTVGLHGDWGLSPYYTKTLAAPLTAVTGFDVGVYASLAWTRGAGAPTGVPAPQ